MPDLKATQKTSKVPKTYVLTSTPQYILPPEDVQKLKNEFQILHLIYHRNRNQHRVAIWWKDFNILHRFVRKILVKIDEFEDAKKYAAKQRLHADALAIAKTLIKRKIFKSCYYSFNGIIALGQFIPLGITLVASLSALYSLVMRMDGLAKTLQETGGPQSSEPKTSSQTIDVADDDLGEEVAFIENPNKASEASVSPASDSSHTTHKRDQLSIEDIFDDNKEKKKKKPKIKKEKKKKKNKNAMDEIFG